MTGAVGLDHIGIAGPDLVALAASYTALGFTLTPQARHSGRRTPGEKVQRYGTGNRCAILRQGYLELIAIVDPAAPTLGLEAFLASRHGAFIIALAMTDPAAELARLRRAGLDLTDVADLQRPLDDADPAGPQARFSLLAQPQAPEGRLQLIRHETPELIWQKRFLDHPNHAVALESLTIAAAEPAESAARLSRLSGRPATPDPDGGYRVAMPHGLVRLLPAAAVPWADAAALPSIAVIGLRTDDSNAALAALLDQRGIACTRDAAGIVVPPAVAGGVALLFASGDPAP